MLTNEVHADTARNAATLLSTTGALVLGIGVGALFAGPLESIAWPLAVIGLVAHLWGMVAGRRVQSRQGYQFEQWETWGYRLCWVLIGLGVIAAGSLLLAS